MQTRILILATFGVFLATAVAAQEPELECGWESSAPAFGYYGTGTPPMLASVTAAPDPVYAGSYALRLEDNSPTGTPQAFIAYLYDLNPGDVIHASVMCYDDTPGADPSCRLWAHWTDGLPNDLDSYRFSAGGTEEATDGTGWQRLEYTWTVGYFGDGIIIEIRTYSAPGDVVFVDDLRIVPPEWCVVVTPCFDVVPVTETSFGRFKALYR